MTVRDTAIRIIGEIGRTWTLKRSTAAPGAVPWGQGASAMTYTKVKARSRHYRPREVMGAIKERDILITVSPDAAVIPAKDDLMARGEFTNLNDASAKWAQVINVYIPEEGESAGVIKVQARY